MKYLKLFEEVDAFDLDEDGNNRLEFENEIGFKRPVWDKEFDLEEIKNILYDIKDIGFQIDIQSRQDIKGSWHDIQDENMFIDNWLDRKKVFGSKTKMDINKPDWVILKQKVSKVLKQKYLDISIYTRRYSTLNKEIIEDTFFEAFERLSEMYDVFYSIYESSDNNFFSFTFCIYNKTKNTQDLLNYRKDINYTSNNKKVRKWTTLNENVDTYNTIKEELSDIRFILEDEKIEYHIMDHDQGIPFRSIGGRKNETIFAKIIVIDKNTTTNRDGDINFSNTPLYFKEPFEEWKDRAYDIISTNGASIYEKDSVNKHNFVWIYLSKPNI